MTNYIVRTVSRKPVQRRTKAASLRPEMTKGGRDQPTSELGVIRHATMSSFGATSVQLKRERTEHFPVSDARETV